MPLTASSPMSPPGKRMGTHDERVGGEGEALPADVHDGGVVEGAAGRGRGERRPDHVAQERGRQLAARAVAEDDPLALGDRGRAGDAVGVDRGAGPAAGGVIVSLIGRPPGPRRPVLPTRARRAAPWRCHLRGRGARGGQEPDRGHRGSGRAGAPSPRPAAKNAAHVPSELTIGAPSGFCGVHSDPYAVQSRGVFSPVRIAPAMQAGCSLVWMSSTVEPALGVEARVGLAEAVAGRRDLPDPAPLPLADLEDLEDLALGERHALALHGADVLVLDLRRGPPPAGGSP